MKAFFIKTNLIQQEYIDVYFYYKEIIKPLINSSNNSDDIIQFILLDKFINEKYTFIEKFGYHKGTYGTTNKFKIMSHRFMITFKLKNEDTEYYIHFN